MELIKELLPILNQVIETKKCSINIHNIDNEVVINIKERFRRQKTFKSTQKSDLISDLAHYCKSA